MIELKNLTKTFETAEGTVEALKNINLIVEDGDIYGIIGMSGAGKSTLVRCINMLERPSSGTVKIDGVDLSLLSEKELRDVRRSISMIFQGFNLLMQRTCLDNVCFPLELSGMKKKDARKKAAELLETVGLPDKALSYPAQLSGGQQQRVAIARALATDPKVLLCDEATSALDPTTTHSILELIRDINRKMGITAIIITHQMSVVEEICRHVAILDKGEVVETGEVSEVFSSPRTAAAKKLVFPEGVNEIIPEEIEGHIVRVVFNGAKSANKPLIASMAMEKNIAVSIIAASTKSIGDQTFGHMVLSLPGDETVLREAMDYLNGFPDIVTEEVR